MRNAALKDRSQLHALRDLISMFSLAAQLHEIVSPLITVTSKPRLHQPGNSCLCLHGCSDSMIFPISPFSTLGLGIHPANLVVSGKKRIVAGKQWTRCLYLSFSVLTFEYHPLWPMYEVKNKLYILNNATATQPQSLQISLFFPPTTSGLFFVLSQLLWLRKTSLIGRTGHIIGTVTSEKESSILCYRREWKMSPQSYS